MGRAGWHQCRVPRLAAPPRTADSLTLGAVTVGTRSYRHSRRSPASTNEPLDDSEHPITFLSDRHYELTVVAEAFSPPGPLQPAESDVASSEEVDAELSDAPLILRFGWYPNS